VSSESPDVTAMELDEAMELVELLACEIGPRRSTRAGERRAAEGLATWFAERGVQAELEGFRGYASFGPPFMAILATAVAPSLLPPYRRRARSLLALLAAGGLISEGSLVHTPLSDAISRSPSQNVVATIEPAHTVRRTLCLMAHVDTSRSGLMFHPRLVDHLNRWVAFNSVLALVAAVGEPLAGGARRGRRALVAARAVLAATIAVVAEREIVGEDVPGANDNATGCAVAAILAARLTSRSLDSTRVVLALTGCEESGTLGAAAFLDAHDTNGWTFLNFDSVGGDGTLRYLRREGLITHWDADPGLVELAEGLAVRRPDLRIAGEDSHAGLLYDTSPVLARGGRGLTLSIQDGFIPNLHRMTDTLANVDPEGVGRAVSAGAELIAAIDRGEAG